MSRRPHLASVEDRRDWLLDIDAAGLRKASGISQQTIARALRVSQSAVCNWENGRKAPVSPAGLAYCRVIAGLLRHLEAGAEIFAGDQAQAA